MKNLVLLFISLISPLWILAQTQSDENNQPIKKGEYMRDADLMDLNGVKHRIADYEGRYILLKFWQAECQYSTKAMAEFEELAKTYEEKLTVIAINVDKSQRLWNNASEMHKISWLNLNDGKGKAGIAAQYGARDIPYFVLISPQGIVLDIWDGYGKGSLKRVAEAHVH
ncbi:MAG: TlpA family protein disulfide reductase [Prevotellaceae bacterium]|jgi:peroxiredoxin|nr:TlpA family protein disulfide reductase [Prevotellaceae bacterium]